MSKVGELIKKRREKLGLTIGDVSKKTAIRQQYIEYLEAGEFDSLASYVHAHGFLEQYSKVLGLDFRDEVKPLFDQECRKEYFGKSSEEIAANIKVQEENERKKRNQKVLAAALVILIAIAIGVVAFILLVKKDDDSDKTVSAVAATATSITQPSNAVVAETQAEKAVMNDNIAVIQTEQQPQQEQVAAIPVKRKATLKYSGECWTYYEIDGGTGEEFTGYKGTEKVIYFDKYFMLDLGNASAVTLEYGTEAFSKLGREGQVVKSLYFEADKEGNLNMSRGRSQ